MVGGGSAGILGGTVMTTTGGDVTLMVVETGPVVPAAVNCNVSLPAELSVKPEKEATPAVAETVGLPPSEPTGPPVSATVTSSVK